MFDECAELDRVAETKTAVRSSAFMGYGNGGRRNRGNAVSKTHLPPLNDPHKFMATIGAGRSTSDYAKNSDIFVQGADADLIFYLQDGRVTVTVISEQGKEANVGILEAGQFFGDGCLSGQPYRIVTTTALTDCRITTIRKASMILVLEAQPWFSKFLSFDRQEPSR